jgi:hypothetical protein
MVAAATATAVTPVPKPSRLRPTRSGWVKVWRKWTWLWQVEHFPRCSVCGASASDVDHVFQRRNIVAEPLASHPVFLASLCAACHKLVTEYPESHQRRDLRIAALCRAGAVWPAWYAQLAELSLEGAARDLERWLRNTGLWDTLVSDTQAQAAQDVQGQAVRTLWPH